jgi:hypothetical protein
MILLLLLFLSDYIDHQPPPVVQVCQEVQVYDLMRFTIYNSESIWILSYMSYEYTSNLRKREFDFFDRKDIYYDMLEEVSLIHEIYRSLNHARLAWEGSIDYYDDNEMWIGGDTELTEEYKLNKRSLVYAQYMKELKFNLEKFYGKDQLPYERGLYPPPIPLWRFNRDE